MRIAIPRALCLAVACSAGMLSAGTQAAVITWNFDNVTGASTPTVTLVPASSGTAANVTVGNLSGSGSNTSATGVFSNATSSGAYPGATAANNYGLYVAPVTGSGYYQVTFTPDPGYQIQINDVNFGYRSTSTGPLRYTIVSDANGDNFTTAIFQAPINNANSVYRYYDSSFASSTDPLSEPVTLRIVVDSGAGSPGSAANGRMDDLTIDVSAVTSTPEPISAGLAVTGLLPLIAGRRRKA